MDSLYLAYRYISYNRIKTTVLVACVTLISFLPFALQLLLDESERQLMSRAVSTPLIVGAKGSALDLVMNTLYFGNEQPETISMQAANRIWDSELALPIPLYTRFQARGNPIVGTTLDYFEFRGMTVGSGRLLAVLGECVVGAQTANDLDLRPGDHLVSSPESVFDLAGVYPLKMEVVGIFNRTHSADDLAIFVDLKTAWVIQGLGHGHQDVTQLKDPSLVLKRSGSNVAATAKLYHYTEISEKNIDSFHFHGNTDAYPITAVIAVPTDEKSGTILQGRYLSKGETQQILRPAEVIDGLLQNIFRIKNVLDAVVSVVVLATVMAIVLVFALSLRLRQREIQTIFKIGCSRIKAIVSPKNTVPIIFSHPVYEYFEKAYGLNGRSVHWEPDQDPTTDQITELTKILEMHPAQWMVWEGTPVKSAMETLKALGIQSAVFNPCGNVPPEGDFLSVMQFNAANLEPAFFMDQ